MENETNVTTAVNGSTTGTYTASASQPTTETIATPAPEPNKTPTVDELQAKLSALEAEKEKLKKAMDAACSDAAKQKKEAAKWQDQYKATLDEQRRKEFETEEANKQLLAQLNEFKAKERVAVYKSKLMSAGYDESTANTMATALPDGIDDSFFEAQRSFLETTKQTVRTQTLNTQPGLSVGTPLSTPPKSEDDELRRWFGLK